MPQGITKAIEESEAQANKDSEILRRRRDDSLSGSHNDDSVHAQPAGKVWRPKVPTSMLRQLEQILWDPMQPMAATSKDERTPADHEQGYGASGPTEAHEREAAKTAEETPMPAVNENEPNTPAAATMATELLSEADPANGAVAAVPGGSPECVGQQCSRDRITSFAQQQLLCEISPFRLKTGNSARHITNGVCDDKGSANGAGTAVLGGGPRTCTAARIPVGTAAVDATMATKAAGAATDKNEPNASTEQKVQAATATKTAMVATEQAETAAQAPTATEMAVTATGIGQGGRRQE